MSGLSFRGAVTAVLALGLALALGYAALIQGSAEALTALIAAFTGAVGFFAGESAAGRGPLAR